jgi:hypothetical protein
VGVLRQTPKVSKVKRGGSGTEGALVEEHFSFYWRHGEYDL